MSTKLNMGKLFSIFLLIVIALALTPSISTSATNAAYGAGYAQTNAIDPSTSNSTTLLYGNLRNDADYMTVTLNGSALTRAGAQNYTVATVGSYTTGAILTLAGLNASWAYTLYVDYDYLLPRMIVSILNLTPMFWVLLIVSIGAVYIIVRLRGLGV